MNVSFFENRYVSWTKWNIDCAIAAMNHIHKKQSNQLEIQFKFIYIYTYYIDLHNHTFHYLSFDPDYRHSLMLNSRRKNRHLSLRGQKYTNIYWDWCSWYFGWGFCSYRSRILVVHLVGIVVGGGTAWYTRTLPAVTTAAIIPNCTHRKCQTVICSRKKKTHRTQFHYQWPIQTAISCRW